MADEKKPWWMWPGILHPTIFAAGAVLCYLIADVGPMRAELAAQREENAGLRTELARREASGRQTPQPTGAAIFQLVPEDQMPEFGPGWTSTVIKPGFVIRQIGMDPIVLGGDEYPVKAWIGVQRVPGQPPMLACLTAPDIRQAIRLSREQREMMMRAAGLIK